MGVADSYLWFSQRLAAKTVELVWHQTHSGAGDPGPRRQIRSILKYLLVVQLPPRAAKAQERGAQRELYSSNPLSFFPELIPAESGLPRGLIAAVEGGWTDPESRYWSHVLFREFVD
jgi:hypothetical protein